MHGMALTQTHGMISLCSYGIGSINFCLIKQSKTNYEEWDSNFSNANWLKIKYSCRNIHFCVKLGFW